MSDTNTDVANAAAQEQAEAANKAELAKWEGDFDPESLKIKYSNEDPTEDETAKDGKDDKTTKVTDDEDEDEVVEQYSDPDPIVTVEDPGEYVPQDYSFEISIDGSIIKVESVDQAEKIAEDNAEKLDAKKIMQLMTKASRMELKQERDHDEWEKKKTLFDSQSETEAQRQETVNDFAGEFEYLVSKQLLPSIADEFKEADWNDPHVSKQPGVKEHIALLNYMVKENQARAKAKVKPITSIVDAHNAWQLDKGRKQSDENNKAAGEARKAAGARVAGVSPSQTGAYVPKGIAVGNPNVLKRSAAMWE